jgi:hypothetical protein
MDKNEVREYLQNTEEGKALAEEIKQPLVQKRDELLTENRQLGEKLKTANQRAADSEELLSSEREAVKRMAIDDELDRHLDRIGVLDTHKEAVKSDLKSKNDFAIEANGTQRVAKSKPQSDEESGAMIGDVVDRWAETDEAKASIKAAVNSGGGATGNSSGGAPATEDAEYAQRFRKAMNLQ